MVAYSQLTLFGISPVKTGTFNIYHDESGTDTTHDRFQFHGALIIPVERLKNAVEMLVNARNGYDGQIHFVEIRDRGKSPKGEIAAEWLRLFFSELSNYCYYKCMMIDLQSPRFDKSRFNEPYKIYNHTSLQAIYGSLVWSLKKYNKVTLSIYSEAISRAKYDNFEEYIPRELARRAGDNKKCPNAIIPLGKVTNVNGNPREVESELAEHCELIQLTDVITGAINQSINAKASQKAKIDLGKLVATWIEDTRMPPWLQEKKLHRRFSVSCFDGDSKYYFVRLAIKEEIQLQPELFHYSQEAE